MRKITWPLTRTSFTRDDLREAFERTFARDQWTMGPAVAQFEWEFAALVGTKNAIFVNSGSSANLLAVAALRLEPGDEVIVPALAWATTYAPLQQHGLRLRVVDIDLKTLNAAPEAVEQAITKYTRGITAVSILGEPAALKQLRAVARFHGLAFWEDNCESLGAITPSGQQAGTFGDVSTFSTFYSHHLATVEGGVVVTNDDRIADIVRCQRSHGWRRDLSKDSRLLGGIELPAFGAAYQFILPGYNVRPLELHAELGLRQLARLPEMQRLRRTNAFRFQELFAYHPHLRPQYVTPGGCSYGLVLIADTPERRAACFARLDAVGIEYRPVTGGSFFRHPAWKHYDVIKTPTPNADHVHDCGFFVGNHAQNLSAELDLLHTTLKDI